jgi:Outer membrane protein beta-barrel domain
MHTTIRTIRRISGNRLNSILGRTAAVTFLAAAGTLGLHAQQSAGTAASLPALDLKTSLIAPLNLSTPLSTPDDLIYSSSVGSIETANAETFSLSSADQPPPRRRYSRPNYHDSRTNPDGSPKYSFYGGGGFGIPTGGTHSYLSPGWGLQIGGGRNFNKHFAANVEFDYDHFGFQTATLNNQLAIYNGPYFDYDLPQIGGTSHVWSFNLEPRYTFFDTDTTGAYVIVGVGFYHKTANFTTPIVIQEDTFYGPIAYQANQTIDKYTSNAPGFNVGFGMTYKFSRFASQRLYGEVRYVYVDNQPRAFDYGDVNFNSVNVFPQNSAKTTYIPVKFGIRF